MKEVNRFIKSVMKIVYANRRFLPVEPLTVVRHEIADGKPMCEIWFMTKGCAYDRDGGCTMCNYGKGHEVDNEIILKQLAEAFQELPKEYYNLIVNPSGSFLDEREVPRELRYGVYELLDNVPFESLTIESRADVITPQLLKELRDRYSDRRVSVEIGVETLNSWALNNSVNKGVSVEKIESAVKFVHDAGLLCIANIGLGIPFVSERANIELAKKSVIDAINMGFDSVILFPYHVKPGTLLEMLYLNDRYKCVSLWSLTEVLTQLPSEYVPAVNISWYRNYYTDKSKILASPDTCPSCRDKVLSMLDQYKSVPSDVNIAKLTSLKCCCRDKWRAEMKEQTDRISQCSIENDYRFIAEYYHIDNCLLEEGLRESKEKLNAYYNQSEMEDTRKSANRSCSFVL